MLQPAQAAGDSILQQAYLPPNLGISDGISHSRGRWRHTVSSDQEAGGEEHSEIAPVQTHQRQRGRLEASTAPASDRTAVAFRPIRYQMATLSSQLCSHTGGDAAFLRVAPSAGKTLCNWTQCYRHFIMYALKYLYKLNILAPTISPVLTQSSAKRFICCCFPPFSFSSFSIQMFSFSKPQLWLFVDKTSQLTACQSFVSAQECLLSCNQHTSRSQQLEGRQLRTSLCVRRTLLTHTRTQKKINSHTSLESKTNWARSSQSGAQRETTSFKSL